MKPLPKVKTTKMESKYKVPIGYSQSKKGLSTQKTSKNGEKSNTQISSSKIWIQERIKNVSNNTTLLKICFEDSINGIISCEIPQIDAFQRNGVLELVNKGALFEESTARDICTYLKCFLVENALTIKTTYAYPQLGWHDDSFVYGNNIIELNSLNDITYKHITLLNGDENVKSALNTSLDINAKRWIETVLPILEHPRAKFMCYVSTTAPLLKKLNTKSFVVHQWGETSSGKSTLNNLAISIWGDIGKLVNSGHITINYAEEFSQFCKDFPVVFDETQMSSSEDIVNIIYMLANETGKGRARATGGTQTTRKWKVIGLTSGEASVTSDNSFAGADVRVIQLFGGLDSNDEYAVKTFERNIVECMGSLGPHIIKEIIQNADEWIQVYQKMQIKFNQLSKGTKLGDDIKNVGGRLSDTFAAICTAGYLFENLLHEIDKTYFVCDPGDICAEVFQDILFTMSNKGYGQKAWDSFISWMHEKQKYFYIDGMEISQRTYDYYGDIHDEYIDILPNVFNNNFCEKEGFKKDRVLKDWKKYNWIETGGGRNTTTARLKGLKNPTKVIRVRYSLTDDVLPPKPFEQKAIQ